MPVAKSYRYFFVIFFDLGFLREHTIEISAQTYLQKFYNDLGFKATGEEYLEDGLPYVRMVYELKVEG